ncbi:MAG TPA: hypothetical protein VF139_05670 [Candidatus Polarisedimenticolaceae bacterium]
MDLPRPTDPLFFHQRLLEDVFSRLDDAFALHAAGVGRNGTAVLISGPSGFGKTTLAIHLALRGFQFLADDLVLVDRRTGRVEPVRRGVHLRTGSRKLLDASARKRARRAARLRGRDEWTIDPDRWLGPAVPCRGVGIVLLLRPDADLHRVRRLRTVELAFTEGRRRLPSALTNVTGVRTLRRSPDGRQWRIEANDPAAVGAWIETRPKGLRGWAKVADTSPDFDREPRVASIGRFQAAIELAQEMVNRGPGSRLGAVYDGREAELAVDLAARIRDARCYALVPGRLEETLRLIERLCGGISPRPPGRAAPR